MRHPRSLAVLAALLALSCGPELDEVLSREDAATVCTTLQRGTAGSSVADAVIYQGSSWRDGSGPNLWTGVTSPGLTRSLVRWDLSAIPAGVSVLSATATVYVANANTTTVRVHRVTAPWGETTTNWASFADAFEPAVLATFSTGGWATRSFDLTAQVQAWASGASANHGVLLEEDPTYRTGYASSENGTASRRPALTVCWDDAAPPPEDPPPPPGAAPPPPAGSPSAKIAVLGDYGALGPGLEQVAAMIDAWSPDAIVTTGDNVYSDDAEPYDGIVGRYYHAYIGGYDGAWGPGSQTNRFWPTLGNHDDDHLAAYLSYFELPGNERYYEAALDGYGMARLFAYHSDWREPDGVAQTSSQGTWLQDRLAASTACFDIVAMHEPPHGSNLGHAPRTDLRFPYRSWGADVLFAGHQHGYERLLVDGFPHLVVGTGGGGIWGDWTDISPYSVYRYPVSATGWGAVLVTVRVGGGSGEMKIEFFAPGDPVAADAYTFTKFCP